VVKCNRHYRHGAHPARTAAGAHRLGGRRVRRISRLFKILAVHCQEGRRGFANPLIASGLALGPSFGLLFGGTLVAHVGWRPFFTGLGLVSLLWLIPWVRWMSTTDMANLAGNRKGGPCMRRTLAQRYA